MKIVISVIVMVLSYVSIPVFGIWALVEFILYLVKDRPFGWNSLWFLIGSIVSVMVFGLLAAIFAAKDKTKLPEPGFKAKSNFQRRLDEMAEQRKKQTQN